MSKEALAKVVQRAISDAGFRRQLNSDPAGALRGFDLNADELSALRTGNAGRLSSLGIDQRMSKAFVIGGAATATRMSQSDLGAGNPTAFDDGSVGGRTIIPNDPEAASAGTGSVRTGDDWKFADRTASAAPLEGSPEADAAQIASGGGMVNYPAHHGLAGPSGTESVRAGDDYARSARIDDSSRSGTARLDEATGAASGSASVNDDPYGTAFVDDSKDPAYQSVNDDPNGFLAANANADLSGSVVPSNVTDDSDGFLAANAKADATDAYGTAFVDDSKDPAYQSVKDDPDGFLAANANADLSGKSAPETAFINDSEGYLTSVGYDASAASPNAKATWSGDENAGPASVADDDGGASSGSAASESGPNIDH